MATTLAQQLQKLAVPQSTLLQRDKKRASLLFDPKEAAGIDKDTFYDIGISGLKELIKLNTQFAVFENTLYSSASRKIERAVENEDVNSKLNKNIRKFLLLLSPYFLLKPAHKALEWLIYRYSIHEYNKDDVLKLILPYHETNIFVRFLQILNIRNENDKWHWLYQLQKSGVHLPKLTLFNHAASDAGFLQFICDMTVQGIKENGARANTLTTLYSFYCTCTIGALDHSLDVSEKQINAIIPTLLKGMNSQIPDFTASTYMITAKLLKKCKPSTKLLNKLVSRLTQNKNHLHMEAALLLVFIYQTHEDNVSENAMKHLIDNEWILPSLGKLAINGTFILPLILPLVKALMAKIVQDDHKKFFDSLLSELKFSDEIAEKVIRSTLDNSPDMKSTDQKTAQWCSDLLKRFERQYPNPFDKVVHDVMSGKDTSSDKHRQALSSYLNFVMSVPYKQNNVFEKLYHPTADFREQAVSFFVKNYPNLNEKERSIFKNAIEERLLDDNKIVIKAVLTLKRKYLLQLLGNERFIDLLIKLLNICHKKKWYDISITVITLLCNVKVDCNTKIFLAILPFVLPTNNDELIVALHVLKTEFANNCVVLKCAKSKVPQEISPESFCESIYESMCQEKNLPDIGLLMDALDNVGEKTEIHKYMSAILITCAVPKVCHPKLGIIVLKQLISFIEETNMKALKNNDIDSPVAKPCIMSVINGEIPLQGILFCMNTLLEKVVNINLKNIWFNYTQPDEALTFTINIFNFLLNGCSNKKDSKFYSYSLNIFFKKNFPNFKDKVEFFANILVSDNLEEINLPIATQLRAIRALNNILDKTDESISWALNLNSKIFVPSVLICLANPIHEIRLTAVEVLNNITNTVNLKINDTYIPLLNELLSRKSEILLDNEQIALILFSIYEQNGKKFTPIFDALVKIASDCNIPVHISSKLMKLLTFVNSYDILETFANTGCNILNYIGNNEKITDVYRSNIIYNVLLRINETTSENITLNSSVLKFLSLALKHDIVSLKYKKGKFACPSVLALEQINRTVFSNLKYEVQGKLIKLFCECTTSVENPEVLCAINHVIKKIDLDSNLLIDGLTTMRDAKSNKIENSQRKRRATLIPTVDILDTKEWSQGVALLEFIQNKKKIINTDILLPILFGILKKCLDFDEQASLEYPKQLILSSILHCCIKMENKPVPESSFNMELVVQCVRASQNPQTHHHALLLLAHSASVIPQQVLHNIMAIFTFMGSSVLRHDDAYSFQIISKIIDSVIPVLVEVQSEKENASLQKVCGVLRVFVDVILDVPEHRRMSLFTKLLTTLGTKDYLWIFLLLVFESHVLHGNEKHSKNKSSEKVLPRLDAASEITLEYTPEIIIKTNIKLLEFLKKLPVDKDNLIDPTLSILHVKNYTPKQYRHYKYTLVMFLSGLLNSKKLINNVALKDNDETLQMEGLYKNMIINILTYIQDVSKTTERSVGSPQAQYWKVMLHHCYDILDSINALLTKEMFLLVIRGLVVHNIPTVRRKALELFNAKLQHQPIFFYKNSTDDEITECEDLFALLPSLLDIIKTIHKGNSDPELELLQQTALLSLKLLIKLLANKNQEKFAPLLEFITDLVKSDKAQGNILASVVLCLAELVNYLRAYAIPSLVKFMPAIIKVLKVQKHQEVPNLLLMCTITALQKIIESLPLFLSPYLEKMLYEISILTCRWEDTESNHKVVPFVSKLAGIRINLGNKIPSRVLIPIIGHTYNSLLTSKQYDAIGPLMDVLSENLSNVRGPELIALLPELSSFFLTALEFRNESSETVTLDKINIVENYVIKALTVLVLKLSESTFRPFYYRLYDWAIRCDVKNERIITFYRLSAEIAENLKSLFAIFAGHFIKNAASVLDECNSYKSDQLYFEDENKCLLLIESVIKTLKSIFTYDGQSFINRERFEVLMQPLVDQLENKIDYDNLSSRTNSVTIPCIAQFAVSTADDTLWKQLNYQILLKTRHELSVVRLLGLNCVSAVAHKIGEDFLPLLPETIPFLAELLEDEDENVESSCQKVVRELEQVLGEPLQKYF